MGRLFRAPGPEKLVLPILILSLISGAILTAYGSPPKALLYGLGLFAFPTYLSAYATKPLAEIFGGKIYLRRSMLLSFLGLTIAFLVLLIGVLAFPSISKRFILLGWALALWLRQVALTATSTSHPLKSLPSSSVQTILGFVFVPIFFPLSFLEGLMAAILFLSFFLTAVVFTELANSPIKRSFGTSGLSLLRYFLDHMTERGREGTEEIEAFFESISVPIEAHVGLIAFRKKGEIKALMIVPSIHPGPFGYLSGSDLPSKLISSLQDLSPNILVPHGPSTHDFNPSSKKECEKIAEKVRELLPQINYSKSSSPLIRSSIGEASACAQVFGKNILLLSSLAPKPTDDLDYSTGYASIEAAKASGFQDAIFIDAHNCMELGSGLVHFGSKQSRDVVRACAQASKLARKARTRGIRMGLAWRKEIVPTERGFGSQGIQVMVIETGKKKAAYLLFDGNNMVPQLREKILFSAKSLVEESEVLTTDNHVVNATMGGFNPVGSKTDFMEIVKLTEQLVREAIADLEEVEVGMKTGIIEDFKVFGHGSAARLSSVINSTMSTLRLNAIITLSLALAVSALALLLTP